MEPYESGSRIATPPMSIATSIGSQVRSEALSLCLVSPFPPRVFEIRDRFGFDVRQIGFHVFPHVFRMI
jgi:hypothetical protein